MEKEYIVKVGTDLIEDTRILKNIDNRTFMNRIFLMSEQEYIKKDNRKMASIFAIKEAALKALEISTDNWLEIEVKYKNSSKPFVVLSEGIKPQGMFSVDCSISHSSGLTSAFITVLLQNVDRKKEQ